MNTPETQTVRRWQACSIVLAGVLLFVLLINRFEAPRDALGQVPDAGLQRQQMIAHMEASNKKLGEIADILKEIRDQRAEKPRTAPSK